MSIAALTARTTTRIDIRSFAAAAAAVFALLFGALDPAEARGRGHGYHGHHHSGHWARGHHGHWRGGHGHWHQPRWRSGVSIGIGIGAGSVYYGAYGAPWWWHPGYVVAAPPPVYLERPRAERPPEPPLAKGPPDPIFYPKSGQSAEQREADLHECNRWALEQPGAVAKADVFHRATLACMEGRGYAVR